MSQDRPTADGKYSSVLRIKAGRVQVH